MTGRGDDESRVYALLGHPAHHSLSPRMQNAAFRAAGMEAVYVALDVAPGHLGEALRGLHAAGVLGLNLTSPHKEAVWPHLRGATDAATAIRAANTLRREAEGWFGHATDGEGFRQWIASLGLDLSGRRVLLLGAGGAARSIVPVLGSRPPRSVTVVSRNAARARDLAGLLRRSAGVGVDADHASLSDAGRAGSSPPWDVVIRALASDAIEEPERAWWERAESGALALELNYGDRAAASRALGEKRGLRFEDGLGLLLHQGALSYEFWTGARAPIEAMRKALEEPAGRG